MARLSSGFVLGVFLQVPPAASARALSSYALVGRHVLQLVLRIQADAADAVTVPRSVAQTCGHLHLTDLGSLNALPTSKQLRESYSLDR
jgi:hypothetical protein